MGALLPSILSGLVAAVEIDEEGAAASSNEVRILSAICNIWLMGQRHVSLSHFGGGLMISGSA